MSATGPRGRLWKHLFFGLYLAVTVLGGLELLCRYGFVSSSAYTLSRMALAKRALPGYKILILGDSFSLNLENACNWHLERHLERNGAVVLNLAGSGFGPYNYLEMLRLYGLNFAPDLVILGYYVGNDLSDTRYRSARIHGARKLFRELVLRSFLGRVLLENRVRWNTRRRIEAIRPALAKERSLAVAKASPLLVEAGRANPDFLLDNFLVDKPEFREAWRVNAGLLAEARRLAASGGAKFLINVFPGAVQVDDSLYPFFAELGFKLDRRLLTASVPQTLMAQFCKDQGISCFDLLPELRRLRSRGLYEEYDEHWSLDGHEIAFRLVVAKLAELRFIPLYPVQSKRVRKHLPMDAQGRQIRVWGPRQRQPLSRTRTW